jgi:hypothetical protein
MNRKPLFSFFMKFSTLLLTTFTVTYLHAADQVHIDITKNAEEVTLKWEGGTGIYQLQNRNEAGGGPWRLLGWPTTRNSASLSLSAVQEANITTINSPIIAGGRATPTSLTEFFRLESRAQADLSIADNAQTMIHEGRQTFRFDTFGDEDFWGNTLKLHEAIAGAANGGVGPGLSPKMALALGLKVDAEVLPTNLVALIQAGQVNLDEPTNTLALLQLNAVVGLTGFFTNGALKSIGIQCALCHSTCG